MLKTTQTVWTSADGHTSLLVAKSADTFYVPLGEVDLSRLCELGLAISDAIHMAGLAQLPVSPDPHAPQPHNP